MNTIITNSEQETYSLAKKFAKNLKGGEIIGLIGDLGAGKTVFTKGLANGFGIKKTITSPTFVIMKVYEIKLVNCKIKKLIHIDAYRLKSANDLIAIGADEYFKQEDTVVIIEWPKNIKKCLPLKTIYIKFKIEKNTRILTFTI